MIHTLISNTMLQWYRDDSWWWWWRWCARRNNEWMHANKQLYLAHLASNGSWWIIITHDIPETSEDTAREGECRKTFIHLEIIVDNCLSVINFIIVVIIIKQRDDHHHSTLIDNLIVSKSFFVNASCLWATNESGFECFFPKPIRQLQAVVYWTKLSLLWAATFLHLSATMAQSIKFDWRRCVRAQCFSIKVQIRSKDSGPLMSARMPKR